MVIPGARHVSGQKELGTVVGSPVGKRHRGNQGNAAHIDLVALLNHSRKLSGTRRSVTFAKQKLRRGPAIIPRDVLVDKIRKPVRVLNNSVELRRRFTRSRTAVTGRNRVNKNKVAG